MEENPEEVDTQPNGDSSSPATNETSGSSQPTNFIVLVGKHIGASGPILLGLIYTAGLIIWNSHLGSYGTSDLSLVKAQYLLTGLVYSLFLLPLLAPVFLAYILLAKYLSLPQRLSATTTLAAIVIGTLAIFSSLIGASDLSLTRFEVSPTISLYFQGRTRAHSFLILAFVVAISLNLIGRLIGRFIRPRYNTRLRTLLLKGKTGWLKLNAAILINSIYTNFFGVLIFFFIVLYMPVYALEIHPSVKPEFGGGKPTSIRLVVSRETFDRTYPSVKGGPMPEVCGPKECTFRANLIHQSKEHYILSSEGASLLAVALKKNDVLLLEFPEGSTAAQNSSSRYRWNP